MGGDMDVPKLESSARFFERIARLEDDHELADTCKTVSRILSLPSHSGKAITRESFVSRHN